MNGFQLGTVHKYFVGWGCEFFFLSAEGWGMLLSTFYFSLPLPDLLQEKKGQILQRNGGFSVHSGS